MKKDLVIKRKLFEIYGLPSAYADMSYEDTGLSKVKQEGIKKTIERAPAKGTLTIQGTAGPIVTQLINNGRKVRGIDFIAFSSNAFAEHTMPISDVVLLYNVGIEVSTNFNISKQVFAKIRKYYTERNVLLIIETDLGKTDLLSKYDFRVTNFLRVPNKEETIWV